MLEFVPGFFIYLLVMAGVTYLVRMLPLVLVRGKIENKYITSFLYYIPYTVLTAMTIPAIFYSTGLLISAVIGTAVAVILAFFNLGTHKISTRKYWQISGVLYPIRRIKKRRCTKAGNSRRYWSKRLVHISDRGCDYPIIFGRENYHIYGCVWLVRAGKGIIFRVCERKSDRIRSCEGARGTINGIIAVIINRRCLHIRGIVYRLYSGKFNLGF